MAHRVEQLGGQVSYKSNSDGSRSPYELNINYLVALGTPSLPTEPVELVAKRFLSSQAIMLCLSGVPGIYFHSLFGSRNWLQGVALNGHPRAINREKLWRNELEVELKDTKSLRSQVYCGYTNLLKQRTSNPAFHPNGKQRVLILHDGVFALLRSTQDGTSCVLCLQNVTDRRLTLRVDLKENGIGKAVVLKDLLSRLKVPVQDEIAEMKIHPYEVLWLQAE